MTDAAQSDAAQTDGPRVLQAMAGAAVGGAEAFFLRLAIALHRAGQDQHVVLRRHAERAAELRAAGIDPVELPFSGFLDLSTRRRFAAEIARYRPQVVLTWMNRATVFCPDPAPGLPPFVRAARLGGYYKLKYYERCDHLIGNTQGICDYLIDHGWPAARVHHIPNFVDTQTAPPASREEYATPADAPLLFSAGRFHDNKGFDTLLRVLKRLPDCYLWLAGSGPLEPTMRRVSAELGLLDRVRFLGWQKSLAPFFAAADVFVCPSRHEPLGNVVLEAWAQGVPVVSTESEGPTELIVEGSSGLLVPIDDEAEMAGAIQRLLDRAELRERLINGGHLSYDRNFSRDSVVARYRHFFAAVAA